MNTVKCPLCDKEIQVQDGKTRSDALMRHLQDVRHNGDHKKEGPNEQLGKS